ncbi:uncharacterized protein LOC121946056 isoform X2 [Plectropomus leopardus]|uniref:uncharacterized protein LOC121946056 isoform X2 n=1 Tax=Plectropomus leopardus TaxID=160734 RepID=UPI001C4BF701|nr:uncharacterized protein LOC121946056 isoform X2 [Plectropomus leopardus]
MLITAVKDKSVTVITVAADEKSMLPPLCQVPKTLGCSPMCRSVNKTVIRSSTVSVLGTIQIMVGLFNIGLGPGRTSLRPDDFASLGAAYWLGGVFIAVGLVSLIADQFPTFFLVFLAALVNIIGSAFAIFAIVMYVQDMASTTVARLCSDNWYNAGSMPRDDRCIYVAQGYLRLLVAMDITMIILAVQQLFVCITITVLAVRALIHWWKDESSRADEDDEPLLKDVLMTGPGA